MPAQAPPPGRLLAATLFIVAVPAAALLALILTGAARPLPALLALGAVLVAALLIARTWLVNLARLRAAIRRAEAGQTEQEPDRPALLPATEEIAEDVRRLARAIGARADLVLQLRRADAAIIERLPDPLVVLDEHGAPLRTNAAARAIFGGGPGAGDLAALLRHPGLADALDAAPTAPEPREVDIALPVPVSRELKVHLVPMDPPLGDGGRVLLLLSDRTRDRAVERMRADFVANASHELRTPLASLIGFIETLRGPAQGDPEAQARFLGIMADQADRMRRLIDDLLGLTRIEITEHQAPSGRVDLAALAASEADAMAPVLATRKAKLDLALDPGAIAAPADAEQLGQILRNLLENAVRYGRDGGTIRLSVTKLAAGADAKFPALPGVVLGVADDGPGIAREHIPRLTERFYRVDRGRGRNAGGTGLGLAIVKHVVNRHRGVLAIESEQGVGSSFRVWLPSAQEGREEH